MARFSALCSLAIVALVVLQLTEMGVSQSQTQCQFTSTNCTNVCGEGRIRCCTGSNYAIAEACKDEPTWAAKRGECNCCPSGQQCVEHYSAGESTTENTHDCAAAFLSHCMAPQP